MENIAYNILQSLSREPDEECLVVGGEAVNRGAFHKKVTTFVNLLKKKGVKIEHRILMTVSPSIDFYALAVAVFTVGGVLVLVNPGMSLIKINHCVALSQPDVLLFSQQSWLKYLPLVIPAMRAIPLKIDFEGESPGCLPTGGPSSYTPPEAVRLSEHALVTFTTGSTGLPKLLMRRHAFLMNQSRALQHSRRLLDPLFEPRVDIQFTNLIVFLLDALQIGSKGILQQKLLSMDPAVAMATVDKHNASTIGGSPYFVSQLVQHCIENGRKLPCKYVITGGGPVYRRLAEDMCRVVDHPEWAVVTYGSTEAEPISFISAGEKVDLERRGGGGLGLCVGRPVVEGSIRVVELGSDSGWLEELDVGRGTPGEIVVSGWHVNTYQVPKERIIEDSDQHQWLRTEDAGYLDDEGRVWLVGRVKWMVKRGEKTTWSFDVEQNVYDTCPAATYVVYLCHEGRGWLFVETPGGALPPNQDGALQDLISERGYAVDELRVMAFVKKDQRHNSKPDTGALFGSKSFTSSLANAWAVLHMIVGPVGLLVALCLLCLLIGFAVM